MSTLSTFQINQPPGTPYGTWDRSRRDIQLYSVASEKVECEALEKAQSSYLWEMISAPEGVSVTINNPTTHTCDFELNVRGSYLIRLTVNAGGVSESKTTLFIGVAMASTGLCKPAMNETNHDNSQSPYTGERGYEDKLNAWLDKVDEMAGGAVAPSWSNGTVIYVDYTNGDDGTADGTQGKPYKTFSAAASSIAVPTTFGEFTTDAIFFLAPGTYANPVTLPYRQNIYIKGQGVVISGKITWGYDKQYWFGNSSLDYVPMLSIEPDVWFGIRVGAIDSINVAPLNGKVDYRWLQISKALLAGSILNKQSGATGAGEATGTLILSMNDCWGYPLYGAFSGVIGGERESGYVADANTIMLLCNFTKIPHNLYGCVGFYSCFATWFGGSIDYTTNPITLAGSYAGAIGGAGIGQDFRNCEFSPGSKAFGWDGATGSTPGDVRVDANTYEELKSDTFDNIELVRKDTALGTLVDDSAFGGLLAGKKNVQDALLAIDKADIWDSDAVIVVSSGGTPAANGTNLLAAYTAAKSFTPGGAALSHDNRALVLVPPGDYDIAGTALAIDANYVDIIGMGNPCRRRIGSDVLDKPSVRIRGTNTSGVVQQTVRDVILENLRISQGTSNRTCMALNDATNYADYSMYRGLCFDTDGAASGCYALTSATAGRVDATFEECHTQLRGFLWNCDFYGAAYRCSAKQGSFAGNDNAAAEADLVFAGYAEDCEAQDYSFGGTIGGGNITFSGQCVRCKVNTAGFGTSIGGTGPYLVTFSGSCTDCDNAATGGLGSFGYCENGGATAVVFSGSIRRCRGGDSSFCSASTGNANFNGEAVDCDCGDRCFGFSQNNDGEVNGQLLRCNGGDYCFGSTGTPSTRSGRVSSSAVMYYCNAGSYSFAGSATPNGNDQFYGTALRCNGLANCFGTDGDFAGILYSCTCSGYAFGGPGGTTSQVGKILNDCTVVQHMNTIGLRDGIQVYRGLYRSHSSLIIAPFRVTASSVGSPKLNYVEIHASDSATYSVDANGSPQDIRMALCLVNKDIDTDLTNKIGSANNVVDSDVR